MLTAPGSALAAGAGDPAQGKLLFDKHCMVCHGPQGKGDAPTGRALIPPATDFTSQPSRKKSVADLRRVIEQGSPRTAMAGWKGQLSDMQLSDVVTYVETLRGQ
jgi:mono/diheme cytochrome c family protein